MRAPLPVTASAAGTTTAAANVRAVRVDETFYPSSDGKPMAENMWGSRAIVNATVDIEAAHPQALVAADILVYPEEGNRDNKIAPDVLVAFGLGTESRSSYFVWAEGKPPDWVLEVASPSTSRRDLNFKRDYYAAMGVPEYWLFDAKGDVFARGTPRLQGLKLVDGEYRPLEPRLVAGERMIRSEILGLDVRVDGELLRFRDAASGKDVRRWDEVRADEEQAIATAEQAQAAAEQARAEAEQEAAQRKAAEALAEREAALARHESAQRKAADARVEQEAARAGRAEARVAELEAALRRSRAGTSP